MYPSLFATLCEEEGGNHFEIPMDGMYFAQNDFLFASIKSETDSETAI